MVKDLDIPVEEQEKIRKAIDELQAIKELLVDIDNDTKAIRNSLQIDVQKLTLNVPIRNSHI